MRVHRAADSFDVAARPIRVRPSRRRGILAAPNPDVITFVSADLEGVTMAGPYCVVVVLMVFAATGDGGQEAEQQPAFQIPQKPVPAEMKVLERLAGKWKTHSTNKVTEWNPAESENTGRATGRLILGGHYLLLENYAGGDQPYGITIYTYDSEKQSFRSWIFDALGNHVQATGYWDEATKTLRFVPVRKPDSNAFTFRFTDSDRLEYTIVGRDERGKLLIDVAGTWTRQEE
jgi:hypothetical protein